MFELRVWRQSGLTLIELLVTISIAALLLVLAVPSFDEVRKNNQVASQSNELLALINLAKSQAIRINADVELQIGQSANGWWAYVRLPPGESEESPPPDCPNLPGVIRCAEGDSVLLQPGSVELLFNNRGYLADAGNWPAGTTLNLRHSSCQGERQHRRIDVRPTGQISACSLACDASECS